MKIYPKTEIVFKKRMDGLYQQLTYHMIKIEDNNGNITSKIDKTIIGPIFREATVNERSIHGEAEWIDPNTGVKKWLIAIIMPPPKREL
jgi:hypothetical protein